MRVDRVPPISILEIQRPATLVVPDFVLALDAPAPRIDSHVRPDPAQVKTHNRGCAIVEVG
jgi:hypothetical protein